MQGPLLKAIRNKKVVPLFLALKGEILKVIHTRRVRVTLSTQKNKIQRTIYSKSLEITQASLKNALVKTVRSSRTQARLMFGLALRNATRSKYRSFLLIFGILLTVA
ncbi:MAG: hypothetical protein ACW991_03760, partial [Candidatus Hodarchaeales archaeon]